MSQPPSFPQWARTKTVATIGPACREVTMLTSLVRAGTDVFRLNMAHGSRAEHEATIADIRQISRQQGRPLGILVDLAGPKIRLGELFADPTDCQRDGQLRFIRGDVSHSPTDLVANYPRLVDELSPGDRVLLADGTISMQVEEKQGDAAVCRVLAGGVIRSRQGINLPGVSLSLPALTEEDQENAVWAANQQVDFVGLSFVRSPAEVQQLKRLLEAHGSTALVIAKIEKREALQALEGIAAMADAVMVARGDLGVEIDVAEIAVTQKRIIATCQKYLKPVIVATQMLDSMQRSPRPTRAEATDVANAILDGADACMLSGETAIGKYPLESVQTMTRIMLATEPMLAQAAPPPPRPTVLAGVHPITSAVVYGATRIASQLLARLVVIASHSGVTARVRAMQRDYIPCIGVSNSEVTLRRMCLYWGVYPLSGAPLDNGPQLREFIGRWGSVHGWIAKGDRIVFVTGSDLIPGAHNLVVVHEVQ